MKIKEMDIWVQFAPPPLPPTRQGYYLDSFTETHFVGKDPVERLLVHQHQPVQPDHLHHKVFTIFCL